MPIVPPTNLVETKNLTPSYLGLGAAAAAAHAPHLVQMQVAALIAQRQAAEQGFAQTAPFRHAPPAQGYPLYPPWVFSRHGRMFPHFPGSKCNLPFFNTAHVVYFTLISNMKTYQLWLQKSTFNRFRLKHPQPLQSLSNQFFPISM